MESCIVFVLWCVYTRIYQRTLPPPLHNNERTPPRLTAALPPIMNSAATASSSRDSSTLVVLFCHPSTEAGALRFPPLLLICVRGNNRWCMHVRV